MNGQESKDTLSPDDQRKKKNRFLLRNKEKLKLNQYWYSSDTLDTMVAEIEAHGNKVAFLSTPSVYFSIKSDRIRANSKLFDFDTQWERDPGFLFFDFKKPEEIPSQFHHQFDYVVADPPFITPEVWEKYAEAIKLLLLPNFNALREDSTSPNGKVLVSTIAEHVDLLKRLLNASPKVFQPSIPNLIYQYSFYANYDSELLNHVNPEIEVSGSGKKGFLGGKEPAASPIFRLVS